MAQHINWQTLKSNKLALSGAAGLLFFTSLALLAPWIAPYAPGRMFEPLLPPSTGHLLGTNDVGHDLFSELCYGARFSLSISLLSALLSTGIGAWLGIVAGYKTGPGFVIMRVVDLFLVIPRFPLIILMAAFLQPGLETLLLFFVLFGWPGATRLVRAQVLSEKNKAYIEAARLMGARDLHILARHILPSTLLIALTRFIIEFQHVILAESGLSFLGLGNPMVKSWGMMLSFAFRYPTTFITDLWVRWILPPGLCITLVTLCLTFLGFSIEARTNPRLKNKH